MLTTLKEKPLVSVILPVYNAQDYLEAAIESILIQSFRNFELIIVDDASTDDSWKIITQYQKQYPDKIRALRLPENLDKGGDEAGNVAFQEAKGKLIARMDADDIAHPLRLEKQVHFLENNPKVGILGSSAMVIDAQGEEVGPKKVFTNHKQIYSHYFTFHPMIHPTLMIRRSVLKDQNQLYRIYYPGNNDYLTFFSYINEGITFANLAEPLLYYRMHGKNDSLNNVKRTFKNTIKIRLHIVQKYDYQPGLLNWFKCGAQMLLISLLPETIIFHLYLLIRGIHNLSGFANKIWPKNVEPVYSTRG